MVPLLKNPSAEWSHPAITTHGRNNHAVRTEKYRYIRYEDGSEELYDHDADPMEWKNLAGDQNLASVKREMKGHLAELKNVPNAPFDQTKRPEGRQRQNRNSGTSPK
jgi:hypothetical protein